MSTITEASVYKAHRIHITRLYSRPYLSVIVSLGKGTPLTTNSLTATVTRVPGEYPSEAEAIQAAMRYIDEQEAHLGDQSETQAAPASAGTERALAHDSRSQGKQEHHARQLRLYEA
jgi:Arc/MetJ-type ribon-helix-helix transcriptional regulator